MFEDYFAAKRAELGMDREDILVRVQKLLDGWYPDRVRAKQLHQGTLRIVTSSAGVAGELRMRSIELLDAVEGFGEARPTRVAITIGQLRD